MQKYRIEGLSDLVFGLALSIGSLAMISQPVNNLSDITDGLLQFFFSFLIIVSVWVAYTNIVSEIRIESKWDFRLNLALLMMVAIEPYLLFLLGQDNLEILKWASTAYALDVGLIMAILAGLYSKKHEGDIPEATQAQNKFERDRFIGISSVFLISALPFFWVQSAIYSINLRFVIWMLAVLPGLALRALRVRKLRRAPN